MAVPAEIRAVPRPVNTVVEDNGGDGPNRYAVRARGATRYVAGGNPQPHNGRVLGHIVGGRYVPVGGGRAGDAGPDMLSYGASALVRSVSGDLLDDLVDVYGAPDAYAMMAVATLRVIRPSVTSGRLSAHYGRTFVCRDYPGAALSKNSVADLLRRVGADGARRRRFYQLRMARTAADHHVAVDGTLKQDGSRASDLSAFSRRARARGCRDVSVLYAYDVERMEPVCAQVFPGNSIDASSYPAFIRDNGIRRGIIVADKGFPPSRIKEELKARPELHFLTPIKRNDARIRDNGMLSFEGVLEGVDAKVAFGKRRIRGGRFLYSFRDASRAAAEEASYLANARRKGSFSPEAYAAKRPLFGVMVLESDLDLPPETAWRCYEDRWLLELVFRRYKSDECLDRTGVQGDFSVIGSEFVNFLSTVATCRIVRKAEDAGLLGKMSYADLMEDLSSAWRLVGAPADPAEDDGCWVHTLKCVFEELVALGLCRPAAKPGPKRRGRKPKPKEPGEEKPKRPRGRPRKNPVKADPL